MQPIDELYTQYAGKVYRYLLRLCGNKPLAEELTQETFLRAIEKADTFKGDCSVNTWLCAIARNLFYSHRKKRDNNHTSLTDFTASSPCRVEDGIEDREQLMRIHKAMRTLPEPYKEVFSLRILGELTFKEIGQLLNQSETWARVTYFRAKTKLVDILRKDEAV